MLRVFQCKRFPGLDICGVGKFVNGILTLEDESLIEQLKQNDWWGRFIFEIGGMPASAPLPGRPNVVIGGVTTASTRDGVIQGGTSREPVRPPAPAIDPMWAAAEKASEELEEKSQLPGTPSIGEVARMANDELGELALRLGIDVSGDEKPAELRDLIITKLEGR